MCKLIGLTGAAGSGKDTVADYIQMRWLTGRAAFAEPLKHGLREMLNLTVEHTDGDKKEDVLPLYGKSPRQMMQTLGTEWGRQLVSDSIWVDRTMAVWRDHEARDRSMVISDVRFENEADAVRDAGGIVVHVRRPDAQSVSEHVSEVTVPFVVGDAILMNDHEISHLHDEIEWRLRRIIEGSV